MRKESWGENVKWKKLRRRSWEVKVKGTSMLGEDFEGIKLRGWKWGNQDDGVGKQAWQDKFDGLKVGKKVKGARLNEKIKRTKLNKKLRGTSSGVKVKFIQLRKKFKGIKLGGASWGD